MNSPRAASIESLHTLTDADTVRPGDPGPIRAYLAQHSVRTASQEGWSTLRNGDLLKLAEAAGFDVFVTTDKNLRYQQNLSSRQIAIVVLGHQQWPLLRPHVQRVVEAINSVPRGGYVEVEIPIT